MKKYKNYILALFLCLIILPLSAQVVPFSLARGSEIKNIYASDLYGSRWMSLNHFFRNFGQVEKMDTDLWTLTASLSGKQYKFYANSAFYQVNGKWFHLPTTVERLAYGLYIPVQEFILLLQREAFPEMFLDAESGNYYLTLSDFSIRGMNILEMKNGTIVRLKTSKLFRQDHCRVWQGSNQYLYISVYGATADMQGMTKKIDHGVIREIIPVMAKEMLQFNVKLRMKIKSLDYYVDQESGDIVISLRHDYQKNQMPINETQIKNRWLIDTIVIDPGHGGRKSPGAIAPDGTLEKTIALDVALRLGSMLEEKLGVNVVYTRKSDIFVPLWKRPKIANEAGGKLFISIHCNSVSSSSAYGTETYILAPKSTEKSIAIAAAENKVIELEDDRERYDQIFSPEQYILSTMAQSVYMKESETLAQAIESKFHSRLSARSRGVKQASFIVLIGPAMPAVLTEIGFISNWKELSNLKKDSYRQEVAYSLYLAIKDFKHNYEKEIKDS